VASSLEIDAEILAEGIEQKNELEALKAEGKLRHYGVSVERVDEALDAIKHPGVKTVQIIFNMFRMKPAELFFPDAVKRQVAILARAPLDVFRPDALAGHVAVITGGSRGIGAATARELARRGFDVAFTYRNKGGRAGEVAADVERVGGAALGLLADITDPAALDAFATAVSAWRTSIELLVLNASGGLERDLVAADPDYPMRINRDAQVATLDALLPLLAREATVIHVTSHWAHLYGRVPQLPDYEPVARSKHAGE